MNKEKIDNIDQLRATFLILKNIVQEGTAIELSYDEWNDNASNNQRRYYYGVVLPPLLRAYKDTDDQFSSFDVNDFDLLMRMNFHYSLVINRQGKETRVPKRLAYGKVHMKTFCDYINKLIAHAATMGIIILSPEDRGLFVEEDKQIDLEELT